MSANAQQAADNWSASMQSTQTQNKYKNGITNFQGNPMALAAAPDAQTLYKEATAAAVDSGRMAAKLNAVPVSRWKDNAINIGASQLAVGARKALAKMQSHFQRWMPIYGQASQAARALPKAAPGDVNAALARVRASIEVLVANKGK